MPTITCPNCGHTAPANSSALPPKIRCPKCGAEFGTSRPAPDKQEAFQPAPTLPQRFLKMDNLAFTAIVFYCIDVLLVIGTIHNVATADETLFPHDERPIPSLFTLFGILFAVWAWRSKTPLGLPLVLVGAVLTAVWIGLGLRF